MATLISNALNFSLINEKRDREGRYIIVKGRIDNILVTFVNVYTPPESDRKFFKLLFETINSESEGILVCAGDWNTIQNYNLDTTSTNRYKTKRSRDLEKFTRSK